MGQRGQIEEFRVVAAYPRYWVSDHGRVYSTIRGGRYLKQTISPPGYPYVSLMNASGVATKICVHRLVADAFIERKEEHQSVNHKDGNKTNNMLINLEWCTYQENQKHALETGLNTSIGETHYKTKLTKEDVKNIRRRSDGGEIHRIIAADYGLKRQAIDKIVNRQSWKSVP